jgi:hypothetical protein
MDIKGFLAIDNNLHSGEVDEATTVLERLGLGSSIEVWPNGGVDKDVSSAKLKEGENVRYIRVSFAEELGPEFILNSLHKAGLMYRGDSDKESTEPRLIPISFTRDQIIFEDKSWINARA